MVVFFKDTATSEIYTLSLHDALPISDGRGWSQAKTPEATAKLHTTYTEERRIRDLLDVIDGIANAVTETGQFRAIEANIDRKSTRLNSSHANISYAVFCLKKKNNTSP